MRIRMKVLVIAPHADDEVLGMGGTIKKLSKNNQISLCVISEGVTAQYNDEKMMQKRKKFCQECSSILGISKIFFLDFPDMKLNNFHLEINKKLEEIIEKIKPVIVYTSPNNDLNRDHSAVFDSTLVVCRPKSGVKKILSYELQGPTKTSFEPNIFENIEKEFNFKIRGFKKYKSEIEEFPNPRSVLSIENQATYRGIQSGMKKAEAFKLIKEIRE